MVTSQTRVTVLQAITGLGQKN